MKVLLVRPPYDRLRGYHPAPYFPLGVGYIGAVLQKAGHEVKIWNADTIVGVTAGVIPDELTMLKERKQRFELYQKAIHNNNHPVWEETQAILKEFDPDVVGLSVLTPEVGSAYKFSSLAKGTRKDRIVVWGGHHPTFLADNVLSYGVVDVVVCGEGEITVVDLMSALSSEKVKLDEVRGIVYRENGTIHHTPPQDLIEDLDSLPFPAYHLSLYPEAFKRMLSIGLMANRGCPFRCGYCASPAFTRKKLRFRSYENILEEIRYVTKYYNKNIISFLDDNFTINRKKALEFCEHLIEADLKVSWTCMTRADILTEDVVKLLKKAGCCGIAIGIESGSERVLNQIKKDVKLDKVVRAYDLFYRYDIPSGANFIVGFPEETENDIQETFSFMKKLKTVHLAFNIFEPIPGSPLLERCKKLGLVPENVDWRSYGFWPMNHFAKEIPIEKFSCIVYEITKWVVDYRKSLKVRWMRVKPYIKNDLLYPFKKLYNSIRVRILIHFVKDI